VSLTLRREQRDAIWDLVVTHLTGIGDVWIELNNRDVATAKQLAKEFVEDLRLLNDLGWEEKTDRERVTLTVPPGELVHTLARLHREAASALGTYVSRPKDEETGAERNLTASTVLAELLQKLASPLHPADRGAELARRRGPDDRR
jgi:hypothetical protein